MIGLAAITILLMLSWLSLRTNQREFRAEQDSAAGAINSHIDGMKQYLADCAAWDDALEHLVIKLDRNWADVKIGPYLFKSQGYENSFVIDSANRTTYASSGNREVGMDGLRYLGKPLALAISSIRSMDPRKSRKVAGLTKTADGHVAAFAVAPIVSDTGKIAAPRELSFLVLVDVLASEDTTQIGISHQLQGLRQASADERPDLVLRDPQGRAVGGLMWVPRRPGNVLLGSTAPIVAAILTCLFVGASRLLKRARNALDNAQIAIEEMVVSRELITSQEQEARQRLQSTIEAVNAENVRLNDQADVVRKAAHRDAAGQFENEIAPVLAVIHSNATALTTAAGAGRRRVETVLGSMAVATHAATQSEAQSASVSREAVEFEVCAVSIANEANVGLDLARLASKHSVEAHASIGGLSDALLSIDTVVDAIEAVSNQTKLLALNATIEAARAGEAGAGFTVVASEVKELAQQTADLTKSVSDKVKDVRRRANAAISAISGVAEAVKRSDQASGAISAAAGRQLVGSSAVRHSVDAIVVSGHSVTQAIEFAKSALDESFLDADKLEGMSRALNDSLDDLRGAMSHLTGHLRGD